MLVHYGARNAMPPGQLSFLSMAFDGSTIAGRSTISTIFVLPDNRAIIPPPQERLVVVEHRSGHDGERVLLGFLGGGSVVPLWGGYMVPLWGVYGTPFAGFGG